MEAIDDNENICIPVNTGGRAKKSILDISDRQQTRRMKHVVDTLEQFCAEEQIDMYRLLGLAGRKHFATSGQNFDYGKAKVFDQIFDNKDPFEKHSLTIEEASFLRESLELGDLKYKNMKTFLKPHLNLPNTDKLRNLRNELGIYLENTHS